MKVSYQNYRQQKQSSKVMRSYIVQAAAKGATEEELDILCQAYLLEQKYGLAVNSTTERRPPVRRIYDIAVFATRVDAEKVYSQKRITGSLQCIFLMSGCCVGSSEGADGRHITSRLSNRCC